MVSAVVRVHKLRETCPRRLIGGNPLDGYLAVGGVLQAPAIVAECLPTIGADQAAARGRRRRRPQVPTFLLLLLRLRRRPLRHHRRDPLCGAGRLGPRAGKTRLEPATRRRRRVVLVRVHILLVLLLLLVRIVLGGKRTSQLWRRWWCQRLPGFILVLHAEIAAGIVVGMHPGQTAHNGIHHRRIRMRRRRRQRGCGRGRHFRRRRHRRRRHCRGRSGHRGDGGDGCGNGSASCRSGHLGRPGQQSRGNGNSRWW
mmetsp:Transcript_9073/g.32143  ORF Transcript_9073/g.32143 Transcript_9073/m.32143 type:complete len:255 (-) Transcript_9073:754-1518(-)